MEVTRGERFAHMIETFFDLARLGPTDGKGMPYPLMLALSAREFSDVIVFRSPPLVIEVLSLAYSPQALARLSRDVLPALRVVLAPRMQHRAVRAHLDGGPEMSVVTELLTWECRFKVCLKLTYP
jgi:hypothetical protein